MVKISTTHHVTKRGTLKKNPHRRITATIYNEGDSDDATVVVNGKSKRFTNVDSLDDMYNWILSQGATRMYEHSNDAYSVWNGKRWIDE